jgi:hypothetical protein
MKNVLGKTGKTPELFYSHSEVLLFFILLSGCVSPLNQSLGNSTSSSNHSGGDGQSQLSSHKMIQRKPVSVCDASSANPDYSRVGVPSATSGLFIEDLCAKELLDVVDGKCRAIVTVTRANVDQAIQMTEKWVGAEKLNLSSFYSNFNPHNKELPKIPLNGLLKVIKDSAHRDTSYVHPMLAFALRRAEYFIEVLFKNSGPKEIHLGDISLENGGNAPGHPEGTHASGFAADVQYITKGDGCDQLPGGSRFRNFNVNVKNISLERNFWFIYAVMQDRSVKRALSAYTVGLAQYALQAYEAGLINKTALVSFYNTNKNLGNIEGIILDRNLVMNHDRHFHINIDTNLVCHDRSPDFNCTYDKAFQKMFTADNDRYRCIEYITEGLGGDASYFERDKCN